jgi:hypoxanthine phosphoribosyltransferase
VQCGRESVKQFVTAQDLLRDSFELGRRVIAGNFRPSCIVGLWRGGGPVAIAVHELLEYRGIQCDHAAVRTSAYTSIDQKGNYVRLHGLEYLCCNIAADDSLLLVDDVFDSGNTVSTLVTQLQRRCRANFPQQIRVATVYYKPKSNRSNMRPDYFVHETDNWLIFPHELNGLTAAEILEHKPMPQELVA